MNRRNFVVGAAALTVAQSARAAQQVLGPPGPMGTPARAFVAHPQVVRQQCPEWCWAASISMIFATHGHPLDQRKIVTRVFGGLACAAGQPLAVAAALSSAWIDDNGQPFQSRVVAAYDIANQVALINNAIIANELTQNRPLLYANTHHAMVVCDVDFYMTPMGPNVQSVGVLDPWPMSPAFHPLTPSETVAAHLGGQMTFLAAVNVS